MSVVHLNHIRKKLEQDFCPHIDMSDYAGKQPDEIDAARLSRALAAFALAEHAQVVPAAAAADVVDGFDDHGIDAIGIDGQDGVVVVVQSKWDSGGKSSPALGEVEKFARGFNDLLIPRFDRFNAKIQAKKADLTTALDNTDVRFELILTHTGQQPLSKQARNVIEDLLSEINDVSEIVSFHYLGQSQLHALVKQGISGKAPDLTVTLHDWGTYLHGTLGKSGVGFYVDAAPQVAANLALLVTPTPGFHVQIWGADCVLPYKYHPTPRPGITPAALGWTKLASTVATATTRIPLGHVRERRYYLLWITDLGPDPRGVSKYVQIAEFTLFTKS